VVRRGAGSMKKRPPTASLSAVYECYRRPQTGRIPQAASSGSVASSVSGTC
jgi:hypothetical protein